MLENISQAFQGIWGHKMRSVLTMLGIIIGIASIITIVSAIKGTNEQIKENLIGGATNAVVVSLYQDSYTYEMQYSALPEGVAVITEETRQGLETLSGVAEASLFNSRNYANGVYYRNTNFTGGVYGVDSHYFSVYNYFVSYGRGFLQSDYDEFMKVAILDDTAAKSIFPGESALGKTIEISGNPFMVVGVVSQRSDFEPTINSLQDYYMYMNSSAGTIFIPSSAWPVCFRFDEPQSVAIRATSTDDMTKAGQAVGDSLTESQILDKNANFSYKSQDLTDQAQQLQQLTTSTSKQLIWIASISLVVGGIGVMNIMLVSVTERTKEIGLKKALGAKRKRILWQFLTEAAVLTSIGGILGVAVGVGLAEAISKVMGTPTALSVPAMAIAVVFSMIIGVVFGLIPAVKASKLNPIDALRRE